MNMYKRMEKRLNLFYLPWNLRSLRQIVSLTTTRTSEPWKRFIIGGLRNSKWMITNGFLRLTYILVTRALPPRFIVDPKIFHGTFLDAPVWANEAPNTGIFPFQTRFPKGPIPYPHG